MPFNNLFSYVSYHSDICVLCQLFFIYIYSRILHLHFNIRLTRGKKRGKNSKYFVLIFKSNWNWLCLNNKNQSKLCYLLLRLIPSFLESIAIAAAAGLVFLINVIGIILALTRRNRRRWVKRNWCKKDNSFSVTYFIALTIYFHILNW